MDVGGGANLRCISLAEVQETSVRNCSFLSKIVLLELENTPTEM